MRQLYKPKQLEIYSKVRDVDLVQSSDSNTFTEVRSDLTAVLYDETKIAQVNAPLGRFGS